MNHPCPHHAECGGCAEPFLPVGVRIAHRQAEVMDGLREAGVTPPGQLPPLLMAEPWGYRRKARLGAKRRADGSALVGFRRRGGHSLAELSGCVVLDARLAELIVPLRSLIAELEVGAEIPQIEAAAGDDGVILSLRLMRRPGADDLARLGDFARTWGIGLHLQGGGRDSVRPLAGSPAHLHYFMAKFGVDLRFGPHDFVQVNAEINERMVAQALDLLELGPEDRLLDLFCGLGNLSLPAARYAGEVVGLEGAAGTVVQARGNAARNGIANASFEQANLYSAPLGLSPHRPSPLRLSPGEAGFTKAIIDPPRSGALGVIPLLPALGVRRVLYISCYPATLARDAAALADLGFRPVSVGVMDMFPHTGHVEAMALFERG